MYERNENSKPAVGNKMFMVIYKANKGKGVKCIARIFSFRFL